MGVARHAADCPGPLVTADLGHRTETADALADLTARNHFDGVVNNLGLVRAERLGEVTLDADGTCSGGSFSARQIA